MVLTRRVMLTGAALLGGCSSLGTLNGVNTLTPGDSGVERLAHGIAYGADARQALDIYAPAHAAGLPVIVFFYGGSWSSGSRGDYGFAARAMAAQGFVVVVPDYRLVPAVRFPTFVEDGAAAVGWVVANIGRYGGDAGKVAVAGHSAGAYIAVMLALDTRWLAATPVAVKAAVGLAGPYDFAPFVPGGAAERAFGQAPDIALTQPIRFARGDAPPLLLLTGDADDTVEPRNSRALGARVAAVGGRARVVDYAGVGHIGILLALSKPFRSKAPVIADITQFLQGVFAR